MTGTRAFAWSIALFGCAPGGGPLPWASDFGTAIFAVRPEDRTRPTFVVFEGSEVEASDEVSLPRGGEAAVVGFEARPQDLTVPVGRFDAVPYGPEDCEEHRARRFEQGRYFAVTGADGWQTVTEAGAALRGLGLPPLDLAACLHRGGCPDPDRWTCTDRCPDLPAPAAPTLPMPPVLPARCDGCPPGEPAEVSVCPVGSRLDLSAGRCLPLGVCPSPPVEGSLVVDPNAPPGGDGSAEHPYATIAEALRGRPLRLLPGRHAAPNRSFRVPLSGVCGSEVTIVGDLVLVGEAALLDVRVEGTVAVHGSVRLERVAVTGPIDVVDELVAEAVDAGPLIVRTGARATVADASFRGLPAVVAAGAVSGQRVWAIGGGQALEAVVDVAAQGQFDLRWAQIDVPAGLTGLRTAGTATVADLLVRGQDVHTGIFAAEAGRVRGERVLVTGVTQQGILATGAKMDLEDATVEIARSQAWVRGFALVHRTTGRLERVHVRGVGDGRGVTVEDDAEASVADLIVDGFAFGFYGSHSRTHLDRARFRDLSQVGLRFNGSGDHVVRDLTVENPRDHGVELGTDFSDDANGDLARIHVHGAGKAGVRIQRPGFRVEDLRVEGSGAGLDISPLILQEVTTSTVARAEFVGCRTGLMLTLVTPEYAPLFHLQGLQVRGGGVGVTLPRCWPNQAGLLRANRVEGAATSLVFGGP